MSLRRVSLLAALILTIGGSAALSSTAFAKDQNYYSAVTQFMCVSCHESLNQVNSPQAISEKSFLRGLIAKGLTLGQIKSAMVAQYGEQVLARPPASGFNLTVYILPPAVFLGGLALLAFTLPRWRERSRRAAAGTPPGAPPLDGDDVKRLDDELTKFL